MGADMSGTNKVDFDAQTYTVTVADQLTSAPTAKFEYGYAQFEPEGSADESESVIHAQLLYEFQARLQQAPEAALVGDWRCIISVARPFCVSSAAYGNSGHGQAELGAYPPAIRAQRDWGDY